MSLIISSLHFPTFRFLIIICFVRKLSYNYIYKQFRNIYRYRWIYKQLLYSCLMIFISHFPLVFLPEGFLFTHPNSNWFISFSRKTPVVACIRNYILVSCIFIFSYIVFPFFFVFCTFLCLLSYMFTSLDFGGKPVLYNLNCNQPKL